MKMKQNFWMECARVKRRMKRFFFLSFIVIMESRMIWFFVVVFILCYIDRKTGTTAALVRLHFFAVVLELTLILILIS